jgi:hypothetical protein
MPERAVECLHLPVDVRFGDVVEVDQGQCRDAAAGQRFGRPRTDAADADHGDPRGANAQVGGIAIQAAQAAEAALEVGLADVGRGSLEHEPCAGPGLAHFSEARRSLPACAASDFG